MERASEMHYEDIWIETDSLSVVKAYNKLEGNPWRMQARWHNCLHFCSQIRCKFTHVFREGNMVADALAKNGQSFFAC
jgi:ribonuclease HI